MKKFLYLLCFMPGAAFGLDVEDIDFSLYSDAKPIAEIRLMDGTTGWLHSWNGKTLLTVRGKPASIGVYMSQDGSFTFAVDEQGYIIPAPQGQDEENEEIE